MIPGEIDLRHGPAVLEAPRHRPRHGSRRCTFCGLNAHGTSNGVRRCARRFLGLASHWGEEHWLTTDEAAEPWYAYRAGPQSPPRNF